MEHTKEMQNKEYFKEDIYKIIKNMIPDATYGEFTELVHEIILRRCYTFDLTNEQIIKDINSLLENCKKIQFYSDFQDKSINGHIILSKKIIEINKSAFENNPDYERMFKTLTHEIYHAISTKRTENKRVYTGIQFFDKFGKKQGTALNEAFNEVAADMASYHKSEEDEKNFYPKTKAYQNITFVVPLLASALGITVKELSKAGITSRDELLELMCSKIPKNEKNTFLEDFEKFEFHLEQLKALDRMKPTDMSNDDKQNLENSYIEISNFSMNVLYASIIKDNRPITKEVQEEYEYRRDAVSFIIEKAKRNFGKKMLDGYYARITEKVNINTRWRLNSLIIAYNHLSRIENQIDETEKNQLQENIRKNFPLKKYKSYREFETKLIGCKGIEPFNLSEHTISGVRYPIDIQENKYRRMIRTENFDNFKKWDNSEVSQKLEALLLKWKERVTIFTLDNNNTENSKDDSAQNWPNQATTSQKQISTLAIGKRTIGADIDDKSKVSETFEEWKKHMIEMEISKE